MEVKKRLLLSIFLFCCAFTSATTYMLNNPFNLNSESTLTHQFNADIEAFWEKKRTNSSVLWCRQKTNKYGFNHNGL